MCLSCGCNKPNEKHGDERNITMQDIQAAAEAGDVSTREAVSNIQKGFDQTDNAELAGTGSRQSTGGQKTGNNQQKTEDRQGGYQGGGGPQ